MNDKMEIKEKAILIRINRAYEEKMNAFRLYEYTRGRWRINVERASKAEFAFSIYDGVIVEVYKIVQWFESGDVISLIIDDNQEYLKPKDYFDGRYEFVGRLADKEIRNQFKGQSVKHLFKNGNANPIMYLNI